MHSRSLHPAAPASMPNTVSAAKYATEDRQAVIMCPPVKSVEPITGVTSATSRLWSTTAGLARQLIGRPGRQGTARTAVSGPIAAGAATLVDQDKCRQRLQARFNNR